MAKKYKATYSVLPRFRQEMAEEFKKFQLDAEEVGWNEEGEMEYKLTGQKESLVKFFTTAFGCSRKAVIGIIKPEP